MTTKIISTSYPGGYTLSATYSGLEVTNTGAIGGKGLTLSATAAVTNDGDIFSSVAALTAEGGLTLVNGYVGHPDASIYGYSGLSAVGGSATISNFGLIIGHGAKGFGVQLQDGGTLTNGAANDASAIIAGTLDGVFLQAAAKVVNFGRISGYQDIGVYLQAGGSLTNGSATDLRATIEGEISGVAGGSTPITIANFHLIEAHGTASAAISLVGGGEVTNGTASDTLARIYGRFAGIHSTAAATVKNFGSVIGDRQRGISLDNGGLMVNGSTADTVALVQGATQGVYCSGGLTTLRNFGTIVSTTKGSGVAFASGVVTNGSTLAVHALIEGIYHGVLATGAGASIANFGIIDAKGADGLNPAGISMKAAGSVTNGAANDTSATIESDDVAVVINGVGKISNFGTILGPQEAVIIGAGGSLINGSAADTKALIFGGVGVTISGGVGTVSNFGSIIAYDSAVGVGMATTGTLTNGSATDIHALIEGGDDGVSVGAVAKVVNFGTIEAALLGGNTEGLFVSAGSVTNGSASDKTALITGGLGLAANAASATTVTNFGTIRGVDGTALSFFSSGAVLNVEAGSAFQGVVLGGGGTLNLANGTGSLSGMDAYGDVFVSGSMAMATFGQFYTLKIAAGATFTDTGVVSVGTGHHVIDSGVLRLGGSSGSVVNAGTIEAIGSLTLAGTVKNSGLLEVAGGTMTVSGTVTGSGGVTINKGVTAFASAFAENVHFTANGGTLALGRSRTYTGSISGFAKTSITILDLEDIAFKSGVTKASFSGTTTSGTLTVTDGTRTAHIELIGNFRNSTFTVASDGHGGTKVTDPPAAPPASLVAAMAGLPSTGPGLAFREAWRDHAGRPTAPLVHAA
ncbi:MAG TPA: hypothetical protein VG166_04335 [Caulobacteraceae bacterium]|nr:hypothetical protein [Caulobacteraceae bacterium]